MQIYGRCPKCHKKVRLLEVDHDHDDRGNALISQVTERHLDDDGFHCDGSFREPERVEAPRASDNAWRGFTREDVAVDLIR